MTGFEPGFSSDGSDCSANCATMKVNSKQKIQMDPWAYSIKA